MLKILPLPIKLPTRYLVLLIATVVFVCYLPTLNNGFIWDDNANLVNNINYRGLSYSNLSWMFTTYHDANYHPLAWLTLGFDFVLWKMNPAGYHLTNIGLHTLNAILFYFMITVFLRQPPAVSNTDLAGAQIAAVTGALFFAVHPLRVENVAWLSTRGDLLCGIFYILTIIAYLKMNENQTAVVRRKWFLLSLLFFVCSLLSRAWGMTMPLVLLILDIYPLQRCYRSKDLTAFCKRLLPEKIPFILLAGGTGVLAFCVKNKGSMVSMADHGILDRFMQAAYGLCFYLFKTLWPTRLSPFYLLSKSFNPMDATYIFSAMLVLGITLGLIFMRHRWPWALASWVCYAVIVSPLLGFVQSGPQIAADRYTYIACMPFGVLAGAGVYRLWTVASKKRLFYAMAIIWTALFILAVMSFRQTRVWHDNLTFLNHIIKLDPENYIAYYDRGLLREKKGDLNGAMADYTKVIRLDPEQAKAYNNRGVLRNGRGDLAGAMQDFNTAVRLAPFSPEAYANRGMIRWSQKNPSKAVQDLTKALEVASADWPHRAIIKKSINDIRKQLAETDELSDIQNRRKPDNK